jgi:predicted membrane protein
MYITVKSIKRTLGFKGIELTDLLIGIPTLLFLLLLFSFSNFRFLAVVLFVISAFLLLPINLSKKNRMYKVIVLTLNYLKKEKDYIFIKGEQKEGIINELFKRIR